MSSKFKEVESSSALFVLKDGSPEGVARALIEGRRQTEPFYVFDLDNAYKNFCYFRDRLPRIKIFYAMKANDDPMMVKLAISAGAGFDCASPGEINTILQLHVAPTSIIYAMPMKSPDQMVFARESGVSHTTFDSSCELEKIKCYWPDARLLIRIKLESRCMYDLGKKFGCDFEEAMDMLEEAAALGLNVIGVAFHVGSGCFSKESYMMGLRLARMLFDHEESKGRKMKILDIGGGFFFDETDQFDQVADLINTGLDELFPEPDLQILAEPGRAMCETAFTLFTKINNVRTIVKDNKKVQNVYINDGINGCLRFAEKWHAIEKVMMNKSPTAINELRDTKIWGPTADDRDQLPRTYRLPPCYPEEWLTISNQGAYCKVFRTKLSEDTQIRSVISSLLWDQLKDRAVFRHVDFRIDPDVSTPLPSILPPLLSQMIVQPHKNGLRLNGCKKALPLVCVTEGSSPDDVARSMINSGQHQPFYTFDMDEVARRIQHFRNMMPRVNIYYLIISNDTDMMLKLTVALGVQFVCSSPREIQKIIQMHVDPRNIMYTMPVKTPEQMAYAREAGVRYITFDSTNELKMLKKYWPDASLLIRIRSDNNYEMEQEQQFGCDFQTEAPNLLDEAAILGLRVVGVTFHVDSSQSPASYVWGLRAARRLFDHEAASARSMHIVDIGGGFRSDFTHRIDEVAPLINATLQDLFPDDSVQIIAEPGRYLSDSAFKLFCSISGVRTIKENDKLINMIYLNDGLYGTMRYHEQWRKFSIYQRFNETPTSTPEDTILWGPSCDCYDRVMKESTVKLPKCSPLDWLVVENHGAYTFTFATKFSSLQMPLIRTVVTKDLWEKLKNSTPFEESDFMFNSYMSAPLPSTLPTPLKLRHYEHPQMPTLVL